MQTSIKGNNEYTIINNFKFQFTINELTASTFSSSLKSYPTQYHNLITFQSISIPLSDSIHSSCVICPIVELQESCIQQLDNEPRQISRERENNQIPYQQVCPKGFQSLRLLSQPDGNSSKSPVAPVMQSQPNIRPNQNSNSLQQYIDNALRTQREEMLKLLEQQNKQIDYMHQQQQLIIQQQQSQQEKKKEPVNIESQLNQVKEQLNFQITQTCQGYDPQNTETGTNRLQGFASANREVEISTLSNQPINEQIV
ncbi:unnamed protein product (macronuclear) [Paramecium tetraurelia]|uniref:Uncharacterized protein n=1 Tax=Paramecium tetraurelia TaxID=5888 RepID=A0CYZ4_PARTE|nr:uncharacterized protein GSPATT00011612001 [Paramecium tetraurelia]CAK76011.1 unnamed protein product [Paramecium tetraurelia]|eukprot:XP_001443408.1 hypothetical protein (macronuclear) [Paramecium tetraurelia strain d4-2]